MSGHNDVLPAALREGLATKPLLRRQHVIASAYVGEALTARSGHHDRIDRWAVHVCAVCARSLQRYAGAPAS